METLTCLMHYTTSDLLLLFSFACLGDGDGEEKNASESFDETLMVERDRKEKEKDARKSVYGTVSQP